MKALLDENMPRALIRLLSPEIDARTVQQEGWRGRRNGDLLRAAAEEFDMFITTDQGIPHQQNLGLYDIGVLLLEAVSNRIEDLAPLVPKVKERLSVVKPGVVIRVVI